MVDERNDSAVSLVVSEFEFVEGLIPLYRHYELSVLAGLGLVLTALVAALAAIEAGADPNRSAEAILLSTGAWAPAFLLLIEIVALTRIRRASLYISEVLRPLAQDLTGEKGLLHWETDLNEELFEQTLKAARPGEGPDSSVRAVPALTGADQVLRHEPSAATGDVRGFSAPRHRRCLDSPMDGGDLCASRSRRCDAHGLRRRGKRAIRRQTERG